MRFITKSFVGRTTDDGHLILEHVGYHQTARHAESGKTGDAKYRYRCGVCGNEDAIAQGNHLKRQGHTTHCGCLAKRDTAYKFSNNPKAAERDCYIYLYSTVGGCAFKLGIAGNVRSRRTKSYEDQLFVSQVLPRATAWAVEQVMLDRLRFMGLTYDLEDVPAFDEGESGGSEVFVHLPMGDIINDINDLIDEVKTIGWEALIDKYIAIERQQHCHLFRFRDGRMVQTCGNDYVGQPMDQIQFLNKLFTKHS
jgi:hypothetical protein